MHETTASGGVSGAVLDAADGGDAGEGVGGRGRPYGVGEHIQPMGVSGRRTAEKKHRGNK